MNTNQGEDIDYEFWKDIIINGTKKAPKDWIAFLKNRGFVATLDNPAAIYYKYSKPHYTTWKYIYYFIL